MRTVYFQLMKFSRALRLLLLLLLQICCTVLCYCQILQSLVVFLLADVVITSYHLLFCAISFALFLFLSFLCVLFLFVLCLNKCFIYQKKCCRLLGGLRNDLIFDYIHVWYIILMQYHWGFLCLFIPFFPLIKFLRFRFVGLLCCCCCKSSNRLYHSVLCVNTIFQY